MELVMNGLMKLAGFFGLSVPDVVNDDMSSDIGERSTEERREKFAAFAAIEEEIIDDVDIRSSMEDEDDFDYAEVDEDDDMENF